MNIDKQRFLLLVGAIAASTACTTKGDDGNTGGGGGSSDATTTTASGMGGSGGDATGGGGTGGTGGGECDDSQGTPDACMSACEGFDSCTPLVADLKPAVAVAAVECLNALDPTVCLQPDVDACVQGALNAACADATADDDCATLAPLCGATPDDAAWQAECHGLIDGLTEDARTLVLGCANEGGGCDPVSGGSLFGCVISLSYF